MVEDSEVNRAISALRALIENENDEVSEYYEELCSLYENHWLYMGSEFVQHVGNEILNSLQFEEEWRAEQEI